MQTSDPLGSQSQSAQTQKALQQSAALQAKQFLSFNQQRLAELVTFLDFAEGLTLGFVEINLPANGDTLIQALREHPTCQDMQLEVLDFADQPKLRFLRDEIVQALANLEREPNKKLVLIIRGLAQAIGVSGDYPPVLQDLNFVRDAYKTSVPHPLLFFLPDYAITRLAKYAPDFWAWRSSVFSFKTPEAMRDRLASETLNANQSVSYSGPPESQDRIDQLERLLMDYKPTKQTIAPAHREICSLLMYQLGTAYLSHHILSSAKDYLQQAFEITKQTNQASFLFNLHLELGYIYSATRKWQDAINTFEKALEIARKQVDQGLESVALHALGMVQQNLRNFSKAKELYERCLEIDHELDDIRASASAYHQLGRLAEEQRLWEEAQGYFQKALKIKIEFDDRYFQASTYQNLGILAQEQELWEEAQGYFQKALEIKIDFDDYYAQASTFHQLGMLAQERELWEEAQGYFQKALEIKIDFNDHYAMASTLHQLGIVAQAKRQFRKAQQNFQQALDIFIEYGDRYSQARTYYHLGQVAEETGDIDNARAYYLEDLRITVEFNDEHGLGISLRNLARFYQATQDDALLNAAAQILNTTPDDLKQALAAGVEGGG